MPSSSPARGGAAPARFVPDPLPEVVRSFERAVTALVADAPGAAGEAATATPSLADALAQARAEGYAAARAELPWTEAERLRTAIAALEQGAAALATLRRGAIREQRHAIVELAVALAERMLRRALLVDRDALAGVLERALAAIDAPEGARLRMNEADLAAVEAGHASALARLAAESALELQADPALAPGDLRLVAKSSEVDARLATCLRRLADELADLVDADEAVR